MAVYRVTTYKKFIDRADIKPWSNVYYLDTSSVEVALDGGEAIAQQEKLIMKEYTHVFRVHAVQNAILAASGGSRTVDIPGEVVGDTALMLPLFNAIRCTFSDGVRRPSIRYFRCPLQEDEIENGVLLEAFVADINANYCDNLLAIPGFVSNSGDAYTGAVCEPNIQMRQTDWHRRTRPGFHRGWVAD